MRITGMRSLGRAAFSLAPGMSRTMSPADHSWAASEWVIRLRRAALFYAILEPPLATLSHLRNFLRVCSQLPHDGRAQPRPGLPALEEILVGDWYAPHPLWSGFISLPPTVTAGI